MVSFEMERVEINYPRWGWELELNYRAASNSIGEGVDFMAVSCRKKISSVSDPSRNGVEKKLFFFIITLSQISKMLETTFRKIMRLKKIYTHQILIDKSHLIQFLFLFFCLDMKVFENFRTK